MKLPKKLPKKIPKAQPPRASATSRPPFTTKLPPLSSLPKPHTPRNAAPINAAPVSAAPKSITPKPNALPFIPNRTPPPKAAWEIEEEEERERQKAKESRWKRQGAIGAGLAAFAIGIYTVQLYISLNKEPDWDSIPDDLSDRFDKEADGYDEKVNTAEWMLGLLSRRKELTEQARGHVLEVAVGTGRNFPYYPTKQCDTVTLLDSSAPMLSVARRKWNDTHPEYFKRVFFKHQSALDPITPPYGAQDGYDTVIQTMGLCSTPEPVRLLHSLEAATKEDGGRILLLEHGKSHYDWLNGLLDKTAPGHAMEHGCWWNKDIGKIVEESGLEVVEIKRYNFGTTWWVELKPRKGHGYKQPVLEQIREAVAPPSDSPVSQKSWWAFWR